ncbi:hypothetical protein [Streptomyces sp. NPDC057381]|uniref:hypothetical protein n=1 Tax=unclassified Streptomyces TaxID=2593676 RepID=UPI0036269D0D
MLAAAHREQSVGSFLRFPADDLHAEVRVLGDGGGPGSEAAADGDDEGLDLGVVGEEFQGGGPPQSRPRPPAPRTVADLPGRAFEHTVFVLDGQGAAFAQSVTVPVRQGTALTTSRGEDLRLDADAEGLRVVCASFAIPLQPLEGGDLR